MRLEEEWGGTLRLSVDSTGRRFISTSFSDRSNIWTLTGLGGVVGLSIGWGLTLLLRLLLPSYVPLWAPIGGLVASVGIGLVFGLWPAWKAARLDPIESLRYE